MQSEPAGSGRSTQCELRDWLVNISGESCKRALTQPWPEAYGVQLCRWGWGHGPNNPPTSSLLLKYHSHVLFPCPQGPGACLSTSILSLSARHLTVDQVGGWAWANASISGTFIHLWSLMNMNMWTFYSHNNRASSIKKAFFLCELESCNLPQTNMKKIHGCFPACLFLHLFTCVMDMTL